MYFIHVYKCTSKCGYRVGVRFVMVRRPSANATEAIPVGYRPIVSRRDGAIILRTAATIPPPFHTRTRAPLCSDNETRLHSVDHVPRYRNQFDATVTRSPTAASLFIFSCSMLSEIVFILLFKTIQLQGIGTLKIYIINYRTFINNKTAVTHW